MKNIKELTGVIVVDSSKQQSFVKYISDKCNVCELNFVEILNLTNSNLSVSEWRKVWSNNILKVNLDTPLNTIILVKNLTDIFVNIETSMDEKKAVESLLQDVIVWLESRNTEVNLLIFLEKDILKHVINQNEGQFLSKHKNVQKIYDNFTK